MPGLTCIETPHLCHSKFAPIAHSIEHMWASSLAALSLRQCSTEAVERAGGGRATPRWRSERSGVVVMARRRRRVPLRFPSPVVSSSCTATDGGRRFSSGSGSAHGSPRSSHGGPADPTLCPAALAWAWRSSCGGLWRKAQAGWTEMLALGRRSSLMRARRRSW